MKAWFVMVVYCAVFTVAVGKEPTFQFCEDPWPPYTMGQDSQSPQGGIVVTIVKEIASRAGLKHEMILLPWKRCLQMTESGSLDAVMAISPSSQRSNAFLFSEPFLTSDSYLYVPVQEHSLKGWDQFEDLVDYRIGTTSGYYYGADFEAHKDLLNVQETLTDLQNFRKLELGRIDMFLCNATVADYLFSTEKAFAGKFKKFGKPVGRLELGMAISKNSDLAKHLDRINQIILDLKEEGFIEKVLRDYGKS